MNIQPITSIASKAEELALLQKCASLFSEGTYVHELLSKETIEWIEDQMRNDFPCNLYEHWQSELQAHSTTLASLLKKEQFFKDEYEKMKQAYDNKVTYCQRLETDLTQRNINHEIDIQTCRNAFEEISFKNEGLVASNTQLREEVARLKIMIFDMEHKNG
jgi:hypothetical protein